VKRSQSVRRLLLGGLSAGALGACSPAASSGRVTPETYFTNDDHIPGAGYYHAPFQGFFPHPYNHFDTQKRMYFYGGQWGAEPHRSIVNISAPTEAAARAAQLARTDLPRTSTAPVVRSGFGSTSGTHFSGS
jgi:hypothetical protein